MSYANQLATLTITPNILCSAVYTVLNADATLQGLNYLTSASRIFKFASTVNAPLPRLVISAIILNVDLHTQITTFQLDLEVRSRNSSDSRVPDHTRLDNVIRRCHELLIGHGKLSKTGYKFFDVSHEFTYEIDVSDVDPAESSQSTRLYVYSRAV